MEANNPLIPQQLWLDSFDPVLRLNTGGDLYANPRAAAALYGTAQSKTDWLLFDQIALNEFALLWVPKDTPGATKVRRPKSGNTFTFSARPLLLLRPILRVAVGRIRIIPYRIDQTEQGARFVIDVSKEDNIPSNRSSGHAPRKQR
jgi:hypothetical protein